LSYVRSGGRVRREGRGRREGERKEGRATCCPSKPTSATTSNYTHPIQTSAIFRLPLSSGGTPPPPFSGLQAISSPLLPHDFRSV